MPATLEPLTTYKLQLDDPGMNSRVVPDATPDQIRELLRTERSYSSIFVTDATTAKVLQWFKRDENTNWTWQPLMAHGVQL